MVDDADVAGVQPAVAQRLGAQFRLLPVAVHQQRPAHQNFAVVGDPDLDVLQRRADRAELDAAAAIAADDRRGLGLAVALQQPEAEGGEEDADFVVERRAARDQRLQPAAEAGADLVAHQPIDDPVDEPVPRAVIVSRALVALAAEFDGRPEQPRLQPALRGRRP